MAITTYAELQTAVSNWLHRSDLSTYIPDFITLAETRIYREVRTRDMEAAFTGTVTLSGVALPTNYIDLKYAYISGSPVTWLERKSARWIYQNYPNRAQGGTPRVIAREGTSFIFGPAGTGTITGVAYTRLGSLSATLHGVFTNNPDLYLWGSLAEAEPFLKNDARVALWKAKYNEIRDQVNNLRDEEDQSGSDLAVTTQ